MAGIFNFSRFFTRKRESALSEMPRSLTLSTRKASNQRIEKKISKFLSSCMSNSSNSADTNRRDVISGAFNVWLELPDEIKHDPALDTLRELYERQRGLRRVEVKSVGSDDIVVVQPRGRRAQEDSARSRKLFERKDVHEHAADIFDSKRQQQGVFHEEELGAKPIGMFAVDQPVADQMEIKPWAKLINILNNIKIVVLVVAWIWFTVSFIICDEKDEVILHTHVEPMETQNYIIKEKQAAIRIQLKVTGPFMPPATGVVNASAESNGPHLAVWLERWCVPINRSDSATNSECTKQLSEIVKLELLSEKSTDFVAVISRTQILNLPLVANASEYDDELRSTNTSQAFVVRMRSNIPRVLSLAISYTELLFDLKNGTIYALIILFTLYVFIIFEIVNRMFATIITSTMSLAVLAAVDERPSMNEVMSWIDVESILLLLAMMVFVAILSETGIFDYLAVLAFKLANGRVWPLVLILCLVTAIISSFLDNVTTVLLMTPITIRLCEVMELNPPPVLMAMTIYSNIGGTATPIGDPPNIVIVSNRAVIDAGINFPVFTLHMTIGILLVSVQTFLQMHWKYRDINQLRNSVPPEIQCLKQELAAWKRAVAALADYSADKERVRIAIERHVARLQRRLRHMQLAPLPPIPHDSYTHTLREMEQKYPIRDKELLIKAVISLLFVIMVFFLNSLPEFQRISLAWTALLGAILLLILADRTDLEPIIIRIEWSTLLFFAALFVIMETLAKLGLIDFIGNLTEDVILHVAIKYRLVVAIILLLWVSALVSAFVDNFPLTTMMLRIIKSINSNPALDLPFAPLVWSIAFGSCLGGNGTLIGASANLVCADVAEKHGYRITFLDFLKFGFPLMIGHIVVITAYLIFSHCVFTWH